MSFHTFAHERLCVTFRCQNAGVPVLSLTSLFDFLSVEERGKERVRGRLSSGLALVPVVQVDE